MTTEVEKVPVGRSEAMVVLAGESGFTMAGMAEVFVQSGFFKDVKQQSQAIVKILLGRELGLKEIQAMLSIHMVEGRPEIAAATLGALVKRSGKYTYRVTEHTVDACAIEFFEITAAGKESIGVSRFEMADAVRASLAHKSNYKNYPKNMMFARAMSNGVKWYCLDAVGNIPVYTEGELAEVNGLTGGPASPSEPYAELEPREVLPAEPDVLPSTVVSQEVTPAMSVSDPALTFELNGVQYETKGVTKEQMLTIFDLGPKANKKTATKGYDKEMLAAEFGVTTRKNLTAEAAEKYIIRLTEVIEAE